MVTGARSRCFGDERTKRRRGKKPCAPGGPKPGAQLPPPSQPGVSREVRGGGGPKPVAKPPWAVPSGNWNPASPARTTGKGTRSRLAHFTAPPRPSSTGRSTLHPTAPVEPLATAAFTSSRWPRRERRHRRCRLKS